MTFDVTKLHAKSGACRPKNKLVIANLKAEDFQ